MERAGFDLPSFCNILSKLNLHLNSNKSKDLNCLVDLLFSHGFFYYLVTHFEGNCKGSVAHSSIKPISIVQKQVGHRSFKISSVYLRTSIEKMTEVYDRVKSTVKYQSCNSFGNIHCGYTEAPGTFFFRSDKQDNM